MLLNHFQQDFKWLLETHSYVQTHTKLRGPITLLTMEAWRSNQSHGLAEETMENLHTLTLLSTEPVVLLKVLVFQTSNAMALVLLLLLTFISHLVLTSVNHSQTSETTPPGLPSTTVQMELRNRIVRLDTPIYHISSWKSIGMQ